MNHEDFVRAVHRTRTLLESAREEAQSPRRDPAQFCAAPHLAWMLVESVGFHREGRVEKANRWLGFVQGVMGSLFLATLDELKQANMPEGEVFDREKV